MEPVAHSQFAPPNPGYRDSAAGESVNSTLANRSVAGSINKEVGSAYPAPSPLPHGNSPSEEPKKKRGAWFWVLLVVGLLIVIIVAVIVPVYFKVIKDDGSASSSSAQGGSTTTAPTATSNGPSPTQSATSGKPTTGGDGTTITMEDGKTFVYKNSFGGYWVEDPNDPFNNGARPQAHSPALNETWKWGADVIRGVNLGGWFVLEPFISPALYQVYENTAAPAVDEWTLHQAMAADTARGGLLKLMEEHYATFITEEDFALIAAAGLNWIRLPVPYWAISKTDDEPFLEKVAWKYILKAFKWARKYGLRINLDLHAIPGSQNAFNHSGKYGKVNFLKGAMGIANAERTLNYIRIFTEFISQNEYKDLIPMFGVMNEPLVTEVGKPVITSFYLEMYDMMRKIGADKGPWISIHDGFDALATWNDFLPGADRVALDTHTYLCFGNLDVSPLANQLQRPCTAWGADIRAAAASFGVVAGGEFSLAINDCALYLNGVGGGTRYEGTHAGYAGPKGTGTCEEWTDWTKWDDARKTQLREFALASMDALGHWFFWTWKTGNSVTTGRSESPLWNYRLGWEQGWMPKDPREAQGKCANLAPVLAFKAPGNGVIADTVRTQFAWPPAQIQPNLATANLPRYAKNTPVTPLPIPEISKAIPGFDGWASEDKSPLYGPVPGCTYPNQWDAPLTAPGACAAAAAAKRRSPRDFTPSS